MSLLATVVLEWVTSPLVARNVHAAAGRDFEGSYSGNDVIGLCGARLKSIQVKVRIGDCRKGSVVWWRVKAGPAPVRRVVGGSSVTVSELSVLCL